MRLSQVQQVAYLCLHTLSKHILEHRFILYYYRPQESAKHLVAVESFAHVRVFTCHASCIHMPHCEFCLYSPTYHHTTGN